MREVAGSTLALAGWLDAELVADRVVSQVSIPKGTLADLTSRRAAGFGVTRELCTMTPYGVPQAWAAAFDGEFDGIEYHSRFTTGDLRSVAWFGDVGQTLDEPLTAMSLVEAAERAGIEVRSAPRIPSRRLESPPMREGDG